MSEEIETKEPVDILCVLIGDKLYNIDYVDILYASIKRNTTLPFNFTCMSDRIWDAEYNVIPLVNGWEGWWSKIEMFKHTGRTITMDLDTLITDNIDDLLNLPNICGENEIFMMKAVYRKRTFSTPIMAWNGDFTHVYENFSYTRDKKFDWDQFYVLKALEGSNTTIHAIQDHIKGVYSYKAQWRKHKRDDVKILWFHGVPRIHDCPIDIVKKNWIKDMPKPEPEKKEKDD